AIELGSVGACQEFAALVLSDRKAAGREYGQEGLSLALSSAVALSLGVVLSLEGGLGDEVGLCVAHNKPLNRGEALFTNDATNQIVHPDQHVEPAFLVEGPQGAIGDLGPVGIAQVQESPEGGAGEIGFCCLDRLRRWNLRRADAQRREAAAGLKGRD